MWQIVFSPIRGATHRDRLESFYQRQAAHYDAFRARLLHGREEMVRSAARAAGGGTWIDMGGGTAANLDFAGDEIVMSFARIYVVDLCPSLLAVARQRCAQVRIRTWSAAVSRPRLAVPACMHRLPAALTPLRVTARLAPRGVRRGGRDAMEATGGIGRPRHLLVLAHDGAGLVRRPPPQLARGSHSAPPGTWRSTSRGICSHREGPSASPISTWQESTRRTRSPRTRTRRCAAHCPVLTRLPSHQPCPRSAHSGRGGSRTTTCGSAPTTCRISSRRDSSEMRPR